MHHTELKPIFARGQRRALIALVVGAILFAIFAFIGGIDRFWQAYLYGYIFWLFLSLGGLSALMLHHMVAGAWGFLIQRTLEAASRTLPIMALLFIPLVFAMPVLYEWHPDRIAELEHHHGGEHAEGAHADETHAEDAAGHGGDHTEDAGPEVAQGAPAHEVDPAAQVIQETVEHATHLELIHAKTDYLNPSGYVLRTVLYFALFIGLMFILNRSSRKLDETRNEALVIRMRRVSSVGMVLFVLAMTFAATDWTMSLEPTYFSTMYPPIFIVGQGLAILAFSVVMLNKLKNYRPISDVYNVELVHHIGNLMLAFTVLWAYTSFSQYLITWSGNLAEEIPYYLRRRGGGLTALSIILITFHFAVPFFILLWRRSKRSISFLKTLALFMLLMRALDLYWIITPAFSPYQFRLPYIEIASLMTFGGIWLWWFYRELGRRPLLTERDPRQLVAFTKWEGAAEHA